MNFKQHLKSVRSAVLPLALAAQALAQGPSADLAWQKLDLKNSARSTAPAQVLKAIIPTQPQQSEEAQRLSDLVSIAKDARDFHTKFPADIRAKDARKLEAMVTIQAAHLGSLQHVVTGLDLGSAFRADKTNSAHDRFDVAMAVEILQMENMLRGQRLIDNAPVSELLGDHLYNEFGASPEVTGYYYNLLRTMDRASVLRVAQKISSLALPPDVQEEAKRVLARHDRVGKAVVELVMTTVDGNRIDFTVIKQPTVVYFWNPADGTNDLVILTRFKPTIPSGLSWIYIGLGATPKNLKSVEAAAPFMGQYCYDASGLGSAAAAALSVTQSPQFAVIANGLLIGFGDLEKIQGVLATLSH